MLSFCAEYLFCVVVLRVDSCFALIILKKRELAALLYGLLSVMLLLVFCVTSLGCRGLACDLKLCYFLVIPFHFLSTNIIVQKEIRGKL